MSCVKGISLKCVFPWNEIDDKHAPPPTYTNTKIRYKLFILSLFHVFNTLKKAQAQ